MVRLSPQQPRGDARAWCPVGVQPCRNQPYRWGFWGGHPSTASSPLKSSQTSPDFSQGRNTPEFNGSPFLPHERQQDIPSMNKIHESLIFPADSAARDLHRGEITTASKPAVLQQCKRQHLAPCSLQQAATSTGNMGTSTLGHLSLCLHTNALVGRAQSLQTAHTSARRAPSAPNPAGTMLMPLQAGKYPVKYQYISYKYRYLPQATVGKAPSAPAWAGGAMGQGRSSSLTACSDHSRAQSQTAFMALPRSPALAHPARQPVHPKRQLPVCLGSPPARAELCTARLFCAAQGRISCRLICISLSFHRMPPDFLHQARSFHQGGGPAARSSLAGS